MMERSRVKSQKAVSGGRGLSVPLMVLASLCAALMMVFYISHIEHASWFKNGVGNDYKFGIGPREKSISHINSLVTVEELTNSKVASTLATGTISEHNRTHLIELPTRSTDKLKLSEPMVLTAVQALAQHPLHLLSPADRATMSLADHFVYLQRQAVCKNIPIFTSMANVFSDLYWQL